MIDEYSWRDLAACQDTDIEMVPGGPDDHGSREDIWLAKKVCSGCEVSGWCLSAALGAKTTPQGIWGGLDLAERERLRTTKRAAVQTCTGCRLPCVPLYPDVPKCDGCRTEDDTPKKADDFRAEIEALLAEGRTYRQIANRLGLTYAVVSGAARRWGLRSRPGKRAGGDDLFPCGTPAARVRHKRAGADANDVSVYACDLAGAVFAAGLAAAVVPGLAAVAGAVLGYALAWAQETAILPAARWTCRCRLPIHGVPSKVRQTERAQRARDGAATVTPLPFPTYGAPADLMIKEAA